MTSPIIVSVDIETTGPSPATGSMISLGAVAVIPLPDGGHCLKSSTFYATLDEMKPDAWCEPKRDEGTMKWWEQWPEQWALARLSTRTPEVVMPGFATWLKGLPARPLFLAWPTGFDWQFVCYYLWRYADENPFGYSPLCLKSFAAGLIGNAGAMLSSREEALFPQDWIVTPEFPHHALHDARAQAQMWLKMCAYGAERSSGQS